MKTVRTFVFGLALTGILSLPLAANANRGAVVAPATHIQLVDEHHHHHWRLFDRHHFLFGIVPLPWPFLQIVPAPDYDDYYYSPAPYPYYEPYPYYSPYPYNSYPYRHHYYRPYRGYERFSRPFRHGRH